MPNNKQFDVIKRYLDEEVCLLVDEDLQQPLQRVYHDSQSSFKKKKKTDIIKALRNVNVNKQLSMINSRMASNY